MAQLPRSCYWRGGISSYRVWSWGHCVLMMMVWWKTSWLLIPPKKKNRLLHKQTNKQRLCTCKKTPLCVCFHRPLQRALPPSCTLPYHQPWKGNLEEATGPMGARRWHLRRPLTLSCSWACGRAASSYWACVGIRWKNNQQDSILRKSSDYWTLKWVKPALLLFLLLPFPFFVFQCLSPLVQTRHKRATGDVRRVFCFHCEHANVRTQTQTLERREIL